PPPRGADGRTHPHPPLGGDRLDRTDRQLPPPARRTRLPPDARDDGGDRSPPRGRRLRAHPPIGGGEHRPHPGAAPHIPRGCGGGAEGRDEAAAGAGLSGATVPHTRPASLTMVVRRLDHSMARAFTPQLMSQNLIRNPRWTIPAGTCAVETRALHGECP